MLIQKTHFPKLIFLIIEISLLAITLAPAKPVEEFIVPCSNIEALDELLIVEFGTDEAEVLVEILALLWDEIFLLDGGLLLYSYYDGQLVYLTDIDDTIDYLNEILYSISPLSYYYYNRR